MPEIIIRGYKAADADAVWALHREGVVQGRAEQPNEDYSDYEKDLQNIEEAYLCPGSNFWVVEIGGRVVGMAAVQRIDPQTGRLRRVRVTEAWRRRGLASKLLETAESFCRHTGYGKLILDTMAQQTSAQRLYEAAGFRPMGDRMLGPFLVVDYEKDLE
jgi:ribosomal protein S18 acetylase RimI-like enzyme